MDPKLNASSFVGAQSISVNFTNLFPLGDNEIAQTLLHEMMHCAGYNHPNRIDPPSPNPDVPYDGGKYFGTPPLRAELCIAGQRSDSATIHLMLAPLTDTHLRACPVTNDHDRAVSKVQRAEHPLLPPRRPELTTQQTGIDNS
jgi:hypothetical protein